MKAEGTCWLCGRWANLTREHIPPRSAFNDRPLLLYDVERHSNIIGRLEWAGRREKGLIAVSLCGECNTKCGGQYGSHYVEFLRKVAERVGKARNGERILVAGIHRPLSILKAITQSFVSANGPAFVNANSWVRKFLRSSRNRDWPRDVFLYVFGTKSSGGRKSGVAGFYEVHARRIRVVAEFTFWPLGSVLSFDELKDPRLAPIHHWSQFEYSYEGTVDLWLTINPVATAYPLDFRDKERVRREGLETEEPPRISQEAVGEMIKSVMSKAGQTEKEHWVFVAKQHPRIAE